MRELKLAQIDWNKVSNELNITNGHAARMRYSRFKQQMEGTSGKPRRPRQSAKSRAAKPRQIKEDDEEKFPLGIKPEEAAQMDDHPRTPAMTHSNESMMGSAPCTPVEALDRVKPEPHEDDVSASQRLHSPGLIFDSPEVCLTDPVHGYPHLGGFAMAGNDDRALQHHHHLYHQRGAMMPGIHPGDMLGQDAHSMAVSDCQGQDFMPFGMDVAGPMDGGPHLGGGGGGPGPMMVKRECWNEQPY